MKMTAPTITISYAQSIDGRIATATGDSRWISCERSLEFAHTLRGSHDAIMVGIGTVLADNPRLTCRLPDCQSPHRVILDSSLRLPINSNITQSAGEVATTVLCGRQTIEQKPGRVAELEGYGLGIRGVDIDRDGLSLPEVFKLLGDLDIGSVFVEGGGKLITTLVRQGLVDRFIVVLAPLLIGSGCEAIGDLQVSTLAEAWRGTPISVTQYGDDIAWELRFDREAGIACPNKDLTDGEYEPRE